MLCLWLAIHRPGQPHPFCSATILTDSLISSALRPGSGGPVGDISCLGKGGGGGCGCALVGGGGGGNARCRIRMTNEEMPKGRHAARPIEKAMACIKCAI